MIQNVLALVDLSNPAFAGVVLHRAAALAALDGAKLTVATIAPDFGASTFAGFWGEGPMKFAMDQANEMLEAFVAKTLPGVQAARYLVYYGAAEDRAPEAIEAAEADLVVMAAASAELAQPLTAEGNLSVYLVGG